MEQFDKRINKKIFFVSATITIFIVSCLFFTSFIMFQKISSPYTKKESLYWLYKNIVGFSSKNVGKVKNFDSPQVFYPNIKEEYKLVFVGDVLPMHKKQLLFSDEVKLYINDSDFFIGNFEGIITELESPPSIWNFNIKYNKNILNLFRHIVSPKKIFFSVANNHSFDFGKKEFKNSNRLLKYSGVKLFGLEEKPYIDINKQIRVVGATMWLNKKNEGVVKVDEAFKYVKDGAFNIFYPHFGYEFELYPRDITIKQADSFLNKFDAVIGQHSHCPQPVTVVLKQGVKKLAAYSLGTFFGEVYDSKYQYGLVLKMFLGKDENGLMRLSKVEYKLIKCNILINGSYLVDFSDINLGDFNKQ